MDTIEDAVNALISYDNYILTTHLNPDGDALGSLTGLGLALSKTGKNVVMIMPNPIPAAFQFMPGVQQIKKEVDQSAGFDMAIAVDCTDLNRVGEQVRDVFLHTENIANIDHHISNRFFGNINIVDPQAAATGEIISDILQKSKIPITPDIATNLYTALVTDTGSFRQQNTTAKSLRTAAFLLDCGAQYRVIQQNLYEQRSLESLRLLVSGLQSISLNESGTIAWMTITQKSLLDSGAAVEDSEGVVYGKYWYRFYGEALLDEVVKEKTGRQVRRYSIIMGGKELIIKGPEEIPYKYYESQTKSKILRWRNQTLPVEFVTIEAEEVRHVSLKRSYEEAVEVAAERAREKERKEILEGAVLVRRHYKVIGDKDDNPVRVVLTVETKEDFGVSQGIRPAEESEKQEKSADN
jgi:phosphoesterase RecJ-like protein